MATILALLGELGRPCNAESESPTRNAAEQILAREDTQVLVAEENGAVIGLACLLFLPRLGHASPEARLLDLVVAERARSSGVGRVLVEAAADLAARERCHVLRLECGLQRFDAQIFYRRLGFERRGDDWQLQLPAPLAETR